MPQNKHLIMEKRQTSFSLMLSASAQYVPGTPIMSRLLRKQNDNEVCHYNDVIMTTMASQITSLTRLLTQSFIQTQIKENIKAPRHWPLCGEFTGTSEFPALKAGNAENVSIWWHHHDGPLHWSIISCTGSATGSYVSNPHLVSPMVENSVAQINSWLPELFD